MVHIDDLDRDYISISYPYKSWGFYNCGGMVKIKYAEAGGSVFLTAVTLGG